MVGYYLLYDGDCGICSKSAEIISKYNTEKVFNILPYQFFDFTIYPILSNEIAQQTVILIDKNLNRHFTQSAAVFQILCNLNGVLKIIGKLFNNKLFILLCNPLYKLIAQNRAKISLFFGLNACKVRY